MSLLSNCLFVRQVLYRTGAFSPSTFMNASRLSTVFRYASTNSSAQEQKQNETTPSSADQPIENQTQTEQKSNVDLKQLQEQNAKLTEDANEFKDRYRRALAETENTRVRFNKLVNDAKVFGIQGFCKDLLEVADILNLALANTPQQPSTDITALTKDFNNLRQGLVMTEERMQKIFAKNGLVQIKPNEGDKFDPNFHDALFQAKIPEKTSGTIMQVMKTGYRLQDRVIRAAQFRYASTNSSAQEQKQNETTPSSADQPIENQTQTEQKSNVDLKQLQEQNAKLTEDANEFKDRYRRALAETENTRVRFNKLVNDAKVFGIQGFCKDLLEVADILNLALANTPQQPSTDITALTKDFNNLRQGLVMTEERMQKIFAKNGLVQIKPNEGDKFDPNFHDALFQAKIPEKTSGTIMQVMKTGYRLQDRVIRAAQVGVAQ
ncbi:unnamed protein product [Adineta steineri]|uniref:GrpE protein homolog n=1 Tax=Adineta steineri TaxID=433720 RepID=A0A815J9P7_9BILA|nr:unnamed protein product [Adineta steineri]